MRVLGNLILLIGFLIALPYSAAAQVHISQPLPFGILQVSPNHDSAILHLSADVDAQYTEFSLRVSTWSSDSSSTRLLLDWTKISIINGRVDTTLLLPTFRDLYVLDWHARAILGTGGSIAGLRAGHIFGIAGQSNAEGFNWDMNVARSGDIRMLRDTAQWLPAVEPTGDAAGGPWIVMGNTLWRELKDSLAIGLVNTGVGGTSLIPLKQTAYWHRDPDHPMDTSLYGKALRRFKAAGGKLEALLWLQGESDGAGLTNVELYHDAFKSLIDGFRTDLQQPDLRSFHLQISGNSVAGASPAYLPVVREAHRTLPWSTLVGTAAGRPINPDGLHYTVPTYTAVGTLFAHGLLAELYSRTTSAYPPLKPDTAAFCDSTSADSHTYFLRLRWHRGERGAALRFVNDRQGFVLARDKRYYYDTSEVWSKIDPSDTSAILIGLKRDSITPQHSWTLSYIRTAGAEHAPLATIAPGLVRSTFDTVFALAFLDLPVYLPYTAPHLSVPEISNISAFPNPSAGSLSITLESNTMRTISVTLSDVDGHLVASSGIELSPGLNHFDVPVTGLADQAYFISVQSGNVTLVRKIVLLH